MGSTLARRSSQWTGDTAPPDGPLDDFTGWAGVMSAPQRVRADGWLHPAVRSWFVDIGDMLDLRGVPYVRHWPSVQGTGHGWDDDTHGRFVAICEGLERYSSFVYDLNDFTYACAADLGAAAMDSDRMARFSRAEMAAHPAGVLSRFSRDRTYRWHDGVDLHTGGRAWLPAVMTYLVTEMLETERFWLPLSTGIAVHGTVEHALVGGIAEAVERDAAALCWLQKLPLPLVDPAALAPETVELVRWSADRGMRTLLFDATTDLGIPAVWCLQLSDKSRRAGQICATAAGLDTSSTAHRAVLECLPAREHLESTPSTIRSYRDYAEVTDGAVHMSRRGRRSAFDFLLDRLDERPVVPGRELTAGTPAEALAVLLRVLQEHGQPAYAADLTSREAQQAGLTATRVVLPRLVPMSLQPLSAYRATPRLYEAPARMGHRVLPESRLNRYPIPLG